MQKMTVSPGSSAWTRVCLDRGGGGRSSLLHPRLALLVNGPKQSYVIGCFVQAVGSHPRDPVPLVLLKRQSPEEDTPSGWGRSQAAMSLTVLLGRCNRGAYVGICTQVCAVMCS